MIHVFFTVLSVVVLGVAIATKGGLPQTNKYVLSSETEATSTPTASPTPIRDSTPVPTITPTPTSTESGQPANPVTSFETTWIYPNANVLRKSPTIELSSTDNPKVITDWYKSVISKIGLSTTSFIVTSTNDNIYNKLVASGNRRSVTVIVERKDLSSPVLVTVTEINSIE